MENHENDEEIAVIPDDAKDHFWAVVRECLIELHHHTRSSSQRKVRRLRQKIEKFPKPALEACCHNESFDLACRITGTALAIESHIERYIRIRDLEHSLNSGA